jgi:hypothetical protein
MNKIIHQEDIIIINSIISCVHIILWLAGSLHLILWMYVTQKSKVKVMIVLPSQKVYAMCWSDKVKILDLLESSMSLVEVGKHYIGKWIKHPQ